MSLNSTQKIYCPKCSNCQEFEIWESVNVTLDPKLKEKVLNRNLMTFECDKCGYKAEGVYPLLYHDMDKKLIIYLVPKDEYNEERFERMDLSLWVRMMEIIYFLRLLQFKPIS